MLKYLQGCIFSIIPPSLDCTVDRNIFWCSRKKIINTIYFPPKIERKKPEKVLEKTPLRNISWTWDYNLILNINKQKKKKKWGSAWWCIRTLPGNHTPPSNDWLEELKTWILFYNNKIIFLFTKSDKLKSLK